MADRNSSKILFRPPKPLQSKDFPDDVEQKLRASLGRFSVVKPYINGNVLGISKEFFLRQPDNFLTVPKLPKEDKAAITSHRVQAQTVENKKPKTAEPKKESPKPKVQNPPSGFDFLESLLRSPGPTKEDKKHSNDVTEKPEQVPGASDISDDESNHSSDSLNWLLNISLSDDDDDTTITEENIKENPAKQVPSKNVKEIMQEMIWPRTKSFACLSPIGATPTRKEETIRSVEKTEIKVKTPVETKQVVSRKRKLTDSSTSSCDKDIKVKTIFETKPVIVPRQRKQTDSSTSSGDITVVQNKELRVKTPVEPVIVPRQRKQTDSSTSSCDIKTEMKVKTPVETKPVVASRKRKLTESSNSSCDITEVKTANSRRISRVPTKDTPKSVVKTTSVKEKLISQNYAFGAKPLLIKPPKQSTLANTFPMVGSKNHIAPKKPADCAKPKLIERKPLPPSRQTVQKKPVPKINDELANFFCRKSTMDQIQRSKKRKLDESEASSPIDEKENEVAPIIQVPVSQAVGFVFAQPNLSSSSEDESTAQQKIKFSKQSLDRRNTSDYESSSKRTSSERSESENDRPKAEVLKPAVCPTLSSSSRESSKSKQLTSDYETSSQSSRSEDSDSSQKKVSTVKKAPQPSTNEKNHQVQKSLFTPDTTCHVSAKHDSKDQQKSHQEKSKTTSRSSSLEDSDSSQKKVSTIKKAPPSSINAKNHHVSKPLFKPDNTTSSRSARQDSKDQQQKIKLEDSNSRQKKTSTVNEKSLLSESLFTPDTISQRSTRHDSKDYRKSLGEAKRDTTDKVKHEEKNSKEKHRSRDKQRDKSSSHTRDSKDSKKSKDKHHDRTRSSDSRRHKSEKDKETRTNSNTSLKNEASLKCSIPFSKLVRVDPAWLQKEEKTNTEKISDNHVQKQMQTIPSLEPQFRSNVPRIHPDPNEIEQACSNLSSLMNF